MNVKQLIIVKWNSFLLCLVSLILSHLLLSQSRYILGVTNFILVLAKLLGIFLNRSKLRKFALVGLNMVWASTAYFMLTFQPPFLPALSYYFPLFMVLFGFGISIQERFNE